MCYKVLVYTGDKPGAGTDANVRILFYDEHGTKTPEFELDAFFRDDFERGKTDDFRVKLPPKIKFGKVTKIEFWRDSAGISSSWYVDRISVIDESTKENFDFPVFRWIKPNHHYLIQHLDTALPQCDEHRQQRQMELEEKRKSYKLQVKIPGLAAQVASLPDDENFSADYKWDLQKLKYQLALDTAVVRLTSGKWTDLASLRNIFADNRLPEPRSTQSWTNDSHFGKQRVAGVNPVMIKLCTSLPDKFGVTNDMVKPFLEGLTLQEAIGQNRLFIEDLEIMDGIPCQNDNFVLCSPLGLFFETKDKQLLPVAIQLFQTKGVDNPVFLPSDPPMTWLLAKMWFNNADSAYHQAVTHLGQTHVIMEGICVITHRQLSQSHPIFKLLAPHFLYLLAINTQGATATTTTSLRHASQDRDKRRALDTLISPGGWVDTVQSIGIKGTFALSAKRLQTWRMDLDGTIPEELRQRGLLNTKILAYYPYRDDVLLLYEAIHSYVAKMVNLYYGNKDKLLEDYEIQSWADELVRPMEHGGCGIQGVSGNGHFTDNNQLALVLTSIISTCSVSHAAFNFPQYENYAYAPNYPLMMHGKPPTDKRARTEADIVEALPKKEVILDTILVATLLSQKATKSLGDFDVNFVFDPKALEITESFKRKMSEISQIIKERNKNRQPYEWLDPEKIPNSISI